MTSKLKNLLQFDSFLAAIIVMVIALATLSRLLTYDFSLPYVDNPDEPTLYLKAQEWRGLFDLQGRFRAYPPGTIAQSYITQVILEKLDRPGTSPTVEVMRFVSAVLNILTLVLTMVSAYLIAGLFAATVTGLIWLALPALLKDGVYALADPWISLCAAASLWMALVSIYDARRRSWSVWSGVSGMVAVLFKYNALPLLSISGIATLFQLWHDPRRGRRYLVAVLVLGALVAIYLVFGYDARRMLFRDGSNAGESQKTGILVETRNNGAANLVDWDRISNNVYYTFWSLHANLFLLVSIIGLLALLVAWWRGFPRVRLLGIVLTMAAVISTPWFTAIFSLVSPNHRLRDVLPATGLACVLIGVAAAQVVALFRPGRFQHLLQVGILLLTVFAYRADYKASWQIFKDRRLDGDWRVEVRDWVDGVLEPGTVIVYAENEKTFNPYWGNSEAEKWMPWLRTDSILEHSVSDWRSKLGASYALLSLGERDELAGTPEGRSFLDQLLLLREFKAPPEKRGPEMAFYRLWRMDVAKQVQFGDELALLGYDRNTDTVAPGTTLVLRFYWRATTTPHTNYSLFVHLTPVSDVSILSQADGAPGVDSRPTRLWSEPSETIMSQPFLLNIPPDLEAGPYQIRIGLYDYETFVRLPVRDDQGNGLGDSLPLMTVFVAEAGD